MDRRDECADEGHGAGCGAGEDDQQIVEQRRLNDRMGRIAHKVLVLSGKGGVGKSTVAVNLSLSLMLEGKRVGLLDVDIHGPSVPKMLKLEGETIRTEGKTMLPVELGNLRVMSIGFLLRNQQDAIIWRGPMKMAVIKQFLMDVDWGDLDYLVIDVPPGTGDEPLSVCQLIENADGAVVVTTPQEVALAAVRKSITFCRRLNLPVLGVVENMSGFVCPRCGERIDIFGTGGGERLAKNMNVPFLGRIPIEPEVSASGDVGIPYIQKYPDTATGKAFAEVIRPILEGGAPLQALQPSLRATSIRRETCASQFQWQREGFPSISGTVSVCPARRGSGDKEDRRETGAGVARTPAGPAPPLAGRERSHADHRRRHGGERPEALRGERDPGSDRRSG